MQPLVSVITPAYNRAPYLDETIQSVLNQDYPSVEYIVLDDGSTDNTREVLEKYTGRLIWEAHPNMGETRTVNKGFAMCHGDIVVVVNSDDPLLPGAIGVGAAFMQSHPDVIVAYPDWIYIGPRSQVIRHIQVSEYDYTFMVRRQQCTVGPGAFIRRNSIELAGMRDTEFRYVADFEFWLRLGLCGKFARIPEALATFRTHPGSATASARGPVMAGEHIRLVEKYYSRLDLPDEVAKVRREAFSWAHAFAAATSKPGAAMAFGHLMKSFCYHPWSFPCKWKEILLAVLPLSLSRALAMRWQAVKRLATRNDSGAIQRAT